MAAARSIDGIRPGTPVTLRHCQTQFDSVSRPAPPVRCLSGRASRSPARARCLGPARSRATLVLRGLGSLLLTGGEPRPRLFWTLLRRRMRLALFVLFVLFVVWLHFYLRLDWGWLTPGLLQGVSGALSRSSRSTGREIPIAPTTLPSIPDRGRVRDFAFHQFLVIGSPGSGVSASRALPSAVACAGSSAPTSRVCRLSSETEQSGPRHPDSGWHCPDSSCTKHARPARSTGFGSGPSRLEFALTAPAPHPARYSASNQSKVLVTARFQ